MSLKNPLVKQRVIKSSSIEEDHPGDDIFTKDKQLLASLQRKRVSFEFERPDLEDSDSDEENSLGRHNRPGKRGGFDSLFRSSGEGSDGVETKTEIVERRREKTEVQPPRPIPRRPGSSIQQSSEDRHGASRAVQPNKPVPRLSSPRQQPDAKEARTVPKPRPRLSPRENSPRLRTLGDSGADIIDGPKERPMVLPRKQYKGQTEKSGPQIPVIRTSFYDDKTASYERDTQGRGNRNILERNSAVTTHELYLSESSDEEEESGSSGLSSSMQGGRRLAGDYVERESSGRQPKPLPRGHLTSSGISREGKLVNDSESILQQKHSVSASHVNDREEVRTTQTRASSPTKTDKYVRTPERSRSAKITKENAYREDANYEAEHSKRRIKSEDNFDSERVHEKDRVSQKTLEKDFDAEASLGRRNGAAKLNRTADRNLWSEDSKERVRSGRDATPVQRSSSFDAKLTSAQRKSAGAEGVHRVDSRQSPLPQRPASAKRKSYYRTLERDVTATFEEHVPQQDNVVEVDDELQVERTKFTNRAKVQGSMKPVAGSTPIRGGPLKASRGIDEMTRSSQLREEFMTQRPNDTSSSPTRSLRQKRASSMTDLRGYSPSPVNYVSDDDALQQISLDTTTIRQAVFDNWMSKKNESLKKELAKKTAGKKRQEEKKEEEQREKTTVAKRAFESWNEKKANVFKEQRFKLKEDKKKVEDKSLEKQIKQRDADKFFDSWKAKKDEELKEIHCKKKQEEAKKKRKEREDKQEKTSSASKVYDNWKSKKDEKIKQESKEKTGKEHREAQKKEDEEYEKSLERADKLEDWKQKKGTPRKAPPPPTLTQRSWCPGSRNTGNCIPRTVEPVIQSPVPNRSRKLSGSERFQSGKYDF